MFEATKKKRKKKEAYADFIIAFPNRQRQKPMVNAPRLIRMPMTKTKPHLSTPIEKCIAYGDESGGCSARTREKSSHL